MKIQILGTGCPKCKKLAANAEEAIANTGLDAEIEKIEKLPEIMEFGVMTTPALAIDGEVKAKGKVLSAEQIQDLLEED
ncbi:MAG: thioredoxin family protein [Armatimonadota bacterium]